MTRSIIISFTPVKTNLPAGVTFKEYLYEVRPPDSPESFAVRSTQTEVRVDGVGDAEHKIAISAISTTGGVIGLPALVTLAAAEVAPPGDPLTYWAPSGAGVVVL